MKPVITQEDKKLVGHLVKKKKQILENNDKIEKRTIILNRKCK